MNNTKELAMAFYEKYPLVSTCGIPCTFKVLDKVIRLTTFSHGLESLEMIGAAEYGRNKKAFSICFMNGNYNVYINDYLSADERCSVILHEIGHVMHGHSVSDYICGDSVDALVRRTEEIEANSFAEYYLKMQGDKKLTNDKKRNYIFTATFVCVLAAALSFGPFNRPSSEVILLRPGTALQQTVTPTFNPATTRKPITSEITQKAVYITSHGQKFHLPDCRYVNDRTNITEMTIEKAMDKGYSACSVCKPLE